MNGVDFPVVAGARRDRRRAVGRPGADQGQHRRAARPQRGIDPAAGPLGARRGADPALHRVHGRRARRTAGASTTSCRPTRSSRAIDAELPLEPVAANYRGEVAGRYRYRDGAGELGVIASVTRPFCGDCTRARLSAEGSLYTCLFAGSGTDLKGPLRAGETDDAAGRPDPGGVGGPRRPLLRAAERGDRAPAQGGDVRPRGVTAGPQRPRGTGAEPCRVRPRPPPASLARVPGWDPAARRPGWPPRSVRPRLDPARGVRPRLGPRPQRASRLGPRPRPTCTCCTAG